MDAPAVLLMGQVFERVRAAFAGADWHGLRLSHLRIVDGVGPAGSRASDLARRLSMTKQGAGQLVATLVEQGLLDQVEDPADRRARLLVLTPSGQALRDRLRAELERTERGWATEVGPAEYAAFRRVLSALAARAPHRPPRDPDS